MFCRTIAPQGTVPITLGIVPAVNPRYLLPPLLAAASTLHAADKVTFEEHILPVFQQACLNCHNPDKARGGLDLSSYGATLRGGSGGKIVETGDLASSLLGVIDHSREPKMPPEGDKLAPASIALVKQWIEGGLLENPSSQARKPSSPKIPINPGSAANAKPDGPPPMPEHLSCEPIVTTPRGSAVRALATSPWAPLLAITSQHQILLHHTESLELLAILPFPDGEPITLTFTPNGKHLLAGGGVPGKSGTTTTYDVVTGERILTTAREFDSILAADIRPTFDLVATGGPSRLLKIWRTDSGEPVKTIKKHTDWITALDISPDGVLLASGDRNGGVWVWESDNGNEFHTLRAHQAAITSATFSADSNILATSSQDGTVRFWEMNNGTEVRKNDAHPGGVTSLAFAPNGFSLTAGRDLKARLWKPDFTPAREIATNLPALPTATALDATATRAFIADALGTVHVFATADAKPLGTIPSNPPSLTTRIEQLDQEIAAAHAAPNPDPAHLESLKTKHRHWSAAKLNHQAIETAKTVAENEFAAHAAFAAFATAANEVSRSAATLGTKREERQRFASALPAPTDHPTLHSEALATLAAIDATLSGLTQHHRQLEQHLVKLRTAIEQQAPAHQETANKARELRQAYLDTLPKPPPTQTKGPG